MKTGIGSISSALRKPRHAALYKNVAWQYGLQILKYLFPLVLVPYLTRVLGAEGYAAYAYVLSFMGVMQTVADFGFMLSGTKKVVDLRRDREGVSQLVGDITAARLMLTGALLIATCVFSSFVPIMGENMGYVVLAFASVVARAMLPDFVFQGYEQMGPLTTRYFASRGTTVLLTLLLVRGPGDLVFAGAADAAGNLFGLVWSFLAIRRMFGVRVAAPSLRGALRELADSAIYCVSNVSSSLFSGFATMVVGIAIPDRAEVACWSLALTTVNAVQALFTPITNSLYPHMLNSRDFRFAGRLALLALPVLVVGTVAYCLLAEPIALLLGGEGYGAAAHVMVQISPIFLFSFYGMLVGWPILGAMGRIRELTASTLVAGACNVAALTLLAAFGLIELQIVCLVRWAADALLACLRGFALVRAVRDEDKIEGRGSGNAIR